MFQIISNRAVLFEKTRYEKEMIDGKETGRRVAIVEKKLQVAADSVRPQLVPEWIKEDPHFDMLVEDGQIIEVVAKAKEKRVNTKLKGAITTAETPKAQFVDETKTDSAADEGNEESEASTDSAADATGWGASTQQ